MVVNSSDHLAGSLRDAINHANADPGSTVSITSQVTQPINLTTGELSILANMTIRNDSGAPLEIHQRMPNARVFHIGAANGLNVTITGVSASTPLEITGGSVRGGDGGGIWNGGRLNLSQSTVSGNTADGDGGGLFNDSTGRARIQGSLFDGNDALFGGGMANEGILAIAQSTVSNNTATKKGGGIFSNLNLIQMDVVFANNSPDDVAHF
jgi:predicted outer membrane repeat protein